ncbi:hypothetical protein N6H14_09350 [Paenibacillus sp. CC-CFT747]|nr:hypothetical protein N6H14_09350 [Paenibacillus sp. CC-CFT747]
MGGLLEAVAYRNSLGSLGYSFYYYATQMHKQESIKLLAVDSVVPNPASIASGRYPFTAVLYAVTREGEPAESPVSRVLEWLQTPEGRRTVERGGYVPVEAEGP